MQLPVLSTRPLTLAACQQPKAVANNLLILGRLSKERLARLRGTALNAATECIILDNSNYLTDENLLPAYRRRIRAYAWARPLKAESRLLALAMGNITRSACGFAFLAWSPNRLPSSISLLSPSFFSHP